MSNVTITSRRGFLVAGGLSLVGLGARARAESAYLGRGPCAAATSRAVICGPANDIWTTNDVGMLKGLVSTGVDLSAWKRHLEKNPFDVKPAFLATRTTARLLPQTILGRPSRSPELPQSVVR